MPPTDLPNHTMRTVQYVQNWFTAHTTVISSLLRLDNTNHRGVVLLGYLLQTHEMLFDTLTQAFRVLDCVPQCGNFDNMKTALDRIGRGNARQVNARFAAMASNYLFEPDFCNPAAGWARSRRTSRMHVDACGSRCRALAISMP
jgi:hypothetical protein